jgi:hypothetical protein
VANYIVGGWHDGCKQRLGENQAQNPPRLNLHAMALVS